MLTLWRVLDEPERTRKYVQNLNERLTNSSNKPHIIIRYSLGGHCLHLATPTVQQETCNSTKSLSE